MDIKQLQLHNFWSHKSTTIDFDKDFYMILGKIINSHKSNGSGKSTIARGIAYALYGDASDEIKNDDAIYNNAEKMGVMLTFELNNVLYTIKRKVVRGSSPTIHITKGEEDEVKYGVKAGQEAIIDILGADYSIYKNTSYFKQGDISSFSTLTPKEAKEIVMKIPVRPTIEPTIHFKSSLSKKIRQNTRATNPISINKILKKYLLFIPDKIINK